MFSAHCILYIYWLHITGRRRNGPMKCSDASWSEDVEMNPNVFEDSIVRELIRGMRIKQNLPPIFQAFDR